MSDRSCKMCRKWMALAVEYGDLCYGCCQSELTTNCIPRSELPGLPAWAIGQQIEELLSDSAYWKFQQDGMTRYEFLAALLNTCYPAPTATGNGAGK